MTVLIWIQTVEEEGDGPFIVLSRPSDRGDVGFRLSLIKQVRDTGGADILPFFQLDTGQGTIGLLGRHGIPPGCHHLAATWNGETASLYVNGTIAVEKKVSGDFRHEVIAPFHGKLRLSEVLPVVVSPLEIAVMARAQQRQVLESGRLRMDLDSHSILDGRTSLKGRIKPGDSFGGKIVVAVYAQSSSTPVWIEELPASGARQEMAFEIPLVGLPGGYYRIEVRCGPEETAAAPFALRDSKVMSSGSSDKAVGSWLDAARSAIDLIISSQTRHLPSHMGAVPFVTTCGSGHRAYRSLLHRTGERYASIRFPEEPLEIETFRADHELWPTLDLLSELTGDAQYGLLAVGMVEAYALCGFDESSGLPFLSEECDLDVVHALPHSKGAAADEPRFKPINTGPRTDMHLERFWKHHPQQTHRWIRATFRGLVTDPASMDFNRYCAYGFDDADDNPVLTRNNSHCGFESAASSLILFWAFGWASTGDPECLTWADRMAEKWANVQDPESGLVPNFFGAGEQKFGVPMEAGAWVECRGLALAAGQWLLAAKVLTERPGAEKLATRLHSMGERAAVAVSLFGYDEEKRLFLDYLNLDGSVRHEAARYCFQTSEEKQRAVEYDPLMNEVPVSQGTGFYRNPSYWETCAGSSIPFHLSGAAEFCRNPQLIERLGLMANHAAEDAARLKGAFTPENRWTFRASGWHVQLCIRLLALTGEQRYLQQAHDIANRELEALRRTPSPMWWRTRERTVWLDALLLLHQAQQRFSK